MVIFYKKWKKYNEIKLTKNKMDLNIRKITNETSPEIYFNFVLVLGSVVKTNRSCAVHLQSSSGNWMIN